MKNKNPLYVIKGKDVEEASGLLDLVVKKFNLAPVIDFLNTLMKMLFEQVKNYPTFKAVQELFDEMVARYFRILEKFGMSDT